MNKLYLINHPSNFQGEKKLKNNQNYFEGWYFKNVGQDYNISFIPSISIEQGKQSSYIQVITKNNSYCISYDIKDFKFSHQPFFIQIGKNYFSENKIHIDIKDQSIEIKGDLIYKNPIKLEKTVLSPNIMGPFSYLPFLECNHAILDLKHSIHGSLSVNGISYSFEQGIGYIEKDWGTSFPSSYIWAQGNSFQMQKEASIFLSIADIPLKNFHFNGFICVLYWNQKEYKFTTYNGSKIEKQHIKNNNIDVILKRKDTKIHITSQSKNSSKLLAPQSGSMNSSILESLDSNLSIELEKNQQTIFKDNSLNCGLEIVTSLAKINSRIS